MMRSDKKRAILITVIVLLSACVWFGPVAGSSGASYSIYVKTPGGWTLQEELHPSKYYETSSVDLSAVLPDVDGEYKVRIAQQGGIAAHIDYVALSDGSPIIPSSATCINDGTDILQKVVSLDNDVADAGGKTIECAWAGGSSAPVLLLTANQELYTIEAPLLTPFIMAPELMMPYTIQNNGMFTGEGVPDTGEADFSDYWRPTSGHPWGYTYLWLRSDGEFLYAIMEVTADNTYDETGWACLYVYANGLLKDFRVDATSDEYGIDRFEYTDTVPWQHMVYEFSIPLPEIGVALGDTIKIGFGSYGTGYAAVVEKWVRDPGTGQLVKELTANIGDTLRFKCTITNIHPFYNLSEIRFWDILDCSLQYVGGLQINGESENLGCDPYPFKPRVLHPDGDWNLSDPLGSNFTELCPSHGIHRITQWNDTPSYKDGNVSACDQIQTTSMLWYHVDRVPYTLNLSNANGTKYFDSVLNWDDFTGLIGTEWLETEWLEVCCCKDRYTLIGWEDACEDSVTMRNERTKEVVEYTVKEIAKDLVVSLEHEIDDIEGIPIILEPGQNITIEYDATVVRCGVDNNTFRAKFNACNPEGYCFLSYSNEDKVTIELPTPTAARAPVITPIGIAALISLLSVIAIGTIARLRKKS